MAKTVVIENGDEITIEIYESGVIFQGGGGSGDGSGILYGIGAPASSLGGAGDFYLDTATDDFYGPKLSGLWGTPRNLKGEQGEVGPQGPQGIQGVPGEKGEQGVAGEDGATGLQGEQGIQGEKGEKGDRGLQGLQGPIGLTGADGLSAYEIAVANGFTGTEQEWLVSLNDAGTIDGGNPFDVSLNRVFDGGIV